MKRLLKPLFWPLLAACIIMGLDMFWFEPDSIIIRNSDVTVSNWSKKLNGLKIAVITDLHISKPYINSEKVDRIVELTNRQNPDMVFLLGDYVPAQIYNALNPNIDSRKEVLSTIKHLGRLKAQYGVYAILGNHDWGFGHKDVKDALAVSGITVLENSHRLLSINGRTLAVSGIEDIWLGNADVSKSLHGIPSRTPILFLSHNPDVFPLVPHRVSLTLSGHNHGGQINIPFIRNYTAPSKYGERYISNHIVEENKDLFVSTGIGTTGIPLRLHDVPEIAILKLYKK